MSQQSNFDFHPNHFSDSENIIIINNIPYFNYIGTTYKDKLKNKLSLECLFQHENFIPTFNDMNRKSTEEKDKIYNIKNMDLVDYGEKYGFYEQREFNINGLKRKGKYLPLKKKQARNIKKNTVKTNGYTNKLFIIEQNLPDLCCKINDNKYTDLTWYDNDDTDTNTDTYDNFDFLDYDFDYYDQFW
jgi:hypothetical protein